MLRKARKHVSGTRENGQTSCTSLPSHRASKAPASWLETVALASHTCSTGLERSDLRCVEMFKFYFVKVRCQDDKERNAWQKTSTRTWSVLDKIRVRKPDDFVTSVSKGPKKHRPIKHLKSTSQKPFWTLPEGADCRDGWQHQRKARDLSEFHLCAIISFVLWKTRRRHCFSLCGPHLGENFVLNNRRFSFWGWSSAGMWTTTTTLHQPRTILL